MKKIIAVATTFIALFITLAFTSKSPVKTNSHKNLDYQLFRFDGEIGEEEGMPSAYTWVATAPTTCGGTGSVCYIEAVRASEDPESPDYLHPQFNVSGDWPDVDNDLVIDLREKASQ
jgi:hypothetical protein